MKLSVIVVLALVRTKFATAILSTQSASDWLLNEETNIFIKYYEPLSTDQFLFSQSHQKRDQDGTSRSALHLSFSALGRSFEIHLYKHQSVFSSGASLQIISLDGIKHKNSAEFLHLYQGYVEGEPSSHVHGYIMNDTFDGVIKVSNESFFVEPAWYFFNLSSSYQSIIYRESDIICPWNGGSTSPYTHGTPSEQNNFDHILSIQRAKHVVLNTPTRNTNIFDSINSNYSHESNDTFKSKYDASLNSKESNATPIRQKDIPKTRDEMVEIESKPVNLSSKSSDTVRTCSLYIVVDYSFFVQVGSDLMRALAEVAYHIEETDTVYRGTDFNGDGVGDNVGLSIAGVTIFETTTSENYILSDKMTKADDYLSQFALYNFDAYCMGIVFTSVDFDGGVLGLAWVGYADPYGPPGGICQRRVIYRDDNMPSSLNTALITTINYGHKVPKQVSSITVMHEVAHAFGSMHDPLTKKCAPGGSYGNYIMFPKATNGDKPFNTQFSPCSTSRMAPVIASKGPVCFQYYTGPYCGNQLIEDEEECDCGTTAQCTLRDKCCSPQGGMGTDRECTYMRQTGSVCSPYSSSCCTDDCQLKPVSSKHVCLEESECTQESFCDGESVGCPQSPAKPNGTYCGSGKACLNGICQLGICSILGLPECSCRDTKLLCHICCQMDGKCQPVPKTSPGMETMYQPVGSACNNYTGYCDVNGHCIIVDGDSALDRMRELFTKKGVDDMRDWMAVNWYYIIAVGLGIVLVSTFGIIVQKRVSSESKRMTRRAARLATVWREARRQKALLATQRQRVLDSHCSLNSAAEVSWLNHLFPSADPDTIDEAIRSSDNEKEAVLRLVATGLGIRKLRLH